MQETPGRLLHVWASFRSRQGYLSRNRVFLVLHRDMALRLDVVARSRHSFSRSRQCFTSLS